MPAVGTALVFAVPELRRPGKATTNGVVRPLALLRETATAHARRPRDLAQGIPHITSMEHPSSPLTRSQKPAPADFPRAQHGSSSPRAALEAPAGLGRVRRPCRAGAELEWAQCFCFRNVVVGAVFSALASWCNSEGEVWTGERLGIPACVLYRDVPV